MLLLIFVIIDVILINPLVAMGIIIIDQLHIRDKVFHYF